MTDNDFNNILLYLEQNYALTNKDKILSAIDIIAHQNEYHPIRDVLNGLEYAGTGYIENLFPKYLGVPKSDYCTEVTKIFMLGAISRVFEPGCKFDTMLCIVGGQGIGKSTIFRLLAIHDEWFTDDLKKINDEKCFEKMLGHWIIEMSEMLALKSAKSVEDLKSFITRQSDVYRTPYDRFSQTIKRQCVLCGTTNDMSFLPDDKTGNRRFLPLVVSGTAEAHPLKDEKETRSFVMKAWAEAMALYKSGKYSTVPTKEMDSYLKHIQSDLMPEDTRIGVIQEWLDSVQYARVCSLMIWREAFGHEYDEPDRMALKAINDIMNFKIEGWEKGALYRFRKYGAQRSWKRNCKQERKRGLENLADTYLQESLPFK